MKVLRKYPPKDTVATIYGKEMHKDFEEHLLHGVPLSARFKKYQDVVDLVVKLRGERFVEYPMGVTLDGTACKFDAPDVWWHGIPDVLVVNRDTGVARVVDWKSSKSAKYADTDQLELLALATFAKFPEINKVKGALIFVVPDAVVTKDFTRDQIPLIMSKWIGNISKIEKAMESGVWNPRSGPLCNFCPCKDDCDHAT